ncbi:hypothetical protein [uncultured Megasphaera sp.]|uniref:hypothetical protein n=1 Tax=uncultured Megasphaera sp. TaxID=165188 RepID=UPI0025970E1A|nr:hypothetical protein [uncultured Megasphaera sp.]
MFRLTHRSKTVGYYSTAMDALYKFIEELEERTRATDLVWCGTDKEAYIEVVGKEPTEELTEESFIICVEDSIVLADSQNFDDVARALHEVTGDWDIIEEDDDEEEDE